MNDVLAAYKSTADDRQPTQLGIFHDAVLVLQRDNADLTVSKFLQFTLFGAFVAHPVNASRACNRRNVTSERFLRRIGGNGKALFDLRGSTRNPRKDPAVGSNRLLKERS